MFIPMSTGVRELKLWQEAVALGGEVTRHARQHARRETRAFTDQLVATALAIATSVADGYGRSAATEQRACYRRARRFLGELETTLAVARHADLVTPTVFSQLSVRVTTVGRLLAGYLSFIERQVAAEAAVADGAAARVAMAAVAERAAAARSPAPPADVTATAPPLSLARGD